MRISGGKLKGRSIIVGDAKQLRPTTSLVREAMFSSLSSRGAIEGAAVLDLYCGSGLLGIEALSRGASRASFVDIDRKSNTLEQ